MIKNPKGNKNDKQKKTGSNGHKLTITTYRQLRKKHKQTNVSNEKDDLWAVQLRTIRKNVLLGTNEILTDIRVFNI